MVLRHCGEASVLKCCQRSHNRNAECKGAWPQPSARHQHTYIAVRDCHQPQRATAAHEGKEGSILKYHLETLHLYLILPLGTTELHPIMRCCSLLTRQVLRLVNPKDFLALLERTLIELSQTLPVTTSLPAGFEKDWNLFMIWAKKAHGLSADKATLLLYYQWAEEMQRKFRQAQRPLNLWYAREWQPLFNMACGEAARHLRERCLPKGDYLMVDDFVSNTHLTGTGVRCQSPRVYHVPAFRLRKLARPARGRKPLCANREPLH